MALGVFYTTVNPGGSAVTNPPDWTFIDAVYFCMATMSSVGYGDLTLSSSKHNFDVIFALLGLTVFASLPSTLSRGYYAGRDSFVSTIPAVLPRSWCAYIARNNLKWDDLDKRTEALGLFTILYVGFILLHTASAFIYVHLLGWSFSSAFYHCVITATTIGYGDVSVSTQSARAFACVHMLLSVVYVRRPIAVR